MLMMRAPAVRIMRSRSRAEAASSNLLGLHRAVQKPAPTPHGTRARFAAIHRLISSFRSVPATARITSISGTPATRRRRVGGVGGPPLKASPLRLRAHKRGPPRCPIYACMWDARIYTHNIYIYIYAYHHESSMPTILRLELLRRMSPPHTRNPE